MTDQVSLEGAIECEPTERKWTVLDLHRINKVFFALIIIAFAGYLITANSLSVKGFILRDHNEQLQKLSQENRSLEVKTATLESFDSISKRIESMSLVNSNDVEYIEINDPVVAKK
ncbi:MAG: hypothetical protein V1865_01210 [bacterium]